MDDLDKIIVECKCGCGIFKIDKYEVYTDNEIKELKLDKNKQYEYSLQYLLGSFSAKQHGIFYTIIHRLKLVWKILNGKEYLLEDIVLDQEQLNKLSDKINKFRS